MQKIITNPHPVTVSQEEDAIFNLSINFDLLFFAGLSKLNNILIVKFMVFNKSSTKRRK